MLLYFPPFPKQKLGVLWAFVCVLVFNFLSTLIPLYYLEQETTEPRYFCSYFNDLRRTEVVSLQTIFSVFMRNSVSWVRGTVFSSSQENCQCLFYIPKSVWNFPLKCELQSPDNMTKMISSSDFTIRLSVAETKVANTFMLFHPFCLQLVLCKIGSKWIFKSLLEK